MKNFSTILIISLILLTNTIVTAQWESAIKIVSKPSKAFTTEPNAKGIAAVENFVHIIWYDTKDGNEEIYYRRSTDVGNTWGPPIRITNNFGESSYPSITANASNVHVVWMDDSEGDYQIMYKRSTDAGNTWESENKISGEERPSQPSIAVFDNFVYVTWYAEINGVWDIFYTRSTDGGATLEDVTRMTNDASDSFFSSIAAGDNFVHIVWSEYRDDDEEIYYKRSTDNGATWSTDKRLTNAPGYSDYPSISASGPLVVAVWYDYRNGAESEIFYIRSTDSGETWMEDKVLNSVEGDHCYANVAVSGSFIHVVWYNDDIYYRCSSDAGETWQPDVNLSNNQDAIITSISAEGSAVHVVWMSHQTELYYKKNPTGNIVAVDDNNPVTNLFNISPNPASDYISISNVSDAKTEVNIYNIFGQNVLKSNSSERIDLRELPVGIYYLHINSGNKIERTNFVIMR